MLPFTVLSTGRSWKSLYSFAAEGVMLRESPGRVLNSEVGGISDYHVGVDATHNPLRGYARKASTRGVGKPSRHRSDGLAVSQASSGNGVDSDAASKKSFLAGCPEILILPPQTTMW